MARNARFGPLEPLQIFQDGSFFDQSTPIVSHAPMPSTSAAPRRALQPSSRSAIFNPPSHMPPTRQSPFKPASQGSAPLAPLKASQTNISGVSIMPPCTQSTGTDSLPKKQPLMSRFKTVAQKPVFASAPSITPAHPGKENLQAPMMYPAPSALNLSIESFYQKPSGKRLLDAPPIRDSRPQKKQKLESGPLPPHDSFPLIVDDGTKPGHSYAMLIGMAILRSPHRRLTLSQIYKWISDNFSFYSPNDAGWQNSIRHNLSLNKNFIKHERPKDDPGKGNYWAIEPGMEHLFMKEKPARKSISASDGLSGMSTVLEPSLPGPPVSLMPEPTLPPQLAPAPPPIAQAVATPAPPTSQQQQQQQEPSSDATIPVSDSMAAEEALEKAAHTEPLTDSNGYSPLAAAMHSSPPIPRHLEPRRNTPPPATRRRDSSAAKSHKRKFASMDDSGYISSLDSSVLRSKQNGRILTSEADRPRIKRGRAEEEIARLRASSYDSPTKGRSWSGFMPQSSSPLRQGSNHDAGQMLPPLTPSVKLAPPARPPPSVSPNTNLRLHRAKVQKMVDSPLRRVLDIPEEENQWGTPVGYSFDPTVYDFGSFDVGGVAEFDIFQDSSMASIFPSAEDGSPVKRSLKRPRLERPPSTSVLGEITNTGSRRSLTSAPLLKASRTPSSALETPSKLLMGLPSSPSKLFLQSPGKLPDTSADIENTWLNMEDFCSTDFLEDANDFPGVDITQGFDKIGQPARNSKQTTETWARPQLQS